MASGQAGLFGLAGAANTVELRPRGSPEALTRACSRSHGVASVESGSAVPDAVRTYLDEFLAILRITQMVTLLLALLIAFNTMSIAGEERRREHATMLAFGTPLRRIARQHGRREHADRHPRHARRARARPRAPRLDHQRRLPRHLPRARDPGHALPASIAIAATLGIVAVALAPLLSARRLKQMDIPATFASSSDLSAARAPRKTRHANRRTHGLPSPL